MAILSPSVAPRALVRLATALVVSLTVLAFATESAFAACAGAAARPEAISSGAVEGATLCLLNDERRSRGLTALRSNGRLAVAALRHAGDMASRNYFAHDSLDGRSFVDRLKAAGYVTGREARWTVGENLAWGSGDASSPSRIVAAWMKSPGHRQNILSPAYREIGFGMAQGDAGGSLPSRTVYATEFGNRR